MMPEAMLPAMPSAWTHCVAVERQRRGHARRCAQRAEHRGGMKARLVHALGRDQAQPAHHLAADRDAAREVAAGQRVLLGGGENGRDDHRARMHRAAFEGVVVVLAVRGRAVAQRRGGHVEAARVTDQRARARARRWRAAPPARSRLWRAATHSPATSISTASHIAATAAGKRRRHGGERRRELLRNGEFAAVSWPWRHSASILLARATAFQCATSSAMYLPNCAGVIGITVSACAANVSRNSWRGEHPVDLLVEPAGDRLGHVRRPDDAVPRQPVEPVVARLLERRHVRQQRMRWSPVTASGLNAPERTCGIAAASPGKITWICPPIESVNACPMLRYGTAMLGTPDACLNCSITRWLSVPTPEVP